MNPSHRQGNATADLLARVAELERQVRQIATRSVRQLIPATTFVVDQIAHGLVVGNVVRHNGVGWVKSQANTEANAVIGGIVISRPNANTAVIATPGSYVTGLSSLSLGGINYLSATTAGALTATAPAIARPVVHADSVSSGVFIAGAGGGIPSATSDGLVLATKTDSTPEWVRTLDLGRNASGEAGKLQILSPNAAGVAVEIDAALVTASAKKLTVREIDVCDAGSAKKALILMSAPY
jgi:hypothetical protein